MKLELSQTARIYGPQEQIKQMLKLGWPVIEI